MLQKKNVRFSNGPLAMSEFTLCSRNCLKHLSENLTVVAGRQRPDLGSMTAAVIPRMKESAVAESRANVYVWTDDAVACYPPAWSSPTPSPFHRSNSSVATPSATMGTARLNLSLGWKHFFPLSSPAAPIVTRRFLASNLFLGKKKKKTQGKVDRYQRRGVLCGLLESLSSGFHLKTQRCFLTCFVFILTMNGAASLVSK